MNNDLDRIEEARTNIREAYSKLRQVIGLRREYPSIKMSLELLGSAETALRLVERRVSEEREALEVAPF